MLIVGVLVAGIVVFAVMDTVASAMRLDSTLRMKAERTAGRIATSDEGRALPGEVRVVSKDRVVATGEQFVEVDDVGPLDGFGYVGSSDGRLRVFAVPLGGGRSLQMLDVARPDVIDTLEKASVLLLVVALVGVITYAIGMRFAGRALAPVKESMARLERFSADAGHELRTPLASARASLDVGERTGEWQSAGLRARKEIDRASALVDRLLELARLDPSTLHLERVDVGSLLRHVADGCLPLAAERCTSLVVEAVAGDITADALLLERLVANLVTNALQAADAGSTVTLSFEDRVIRVHNAGPSIPPDEIQRIFEPFYQPERSRESEGSGLGLVIVAAIAEAHGWCVGVSSSQEQGTAFSVDTRGSRRS